MPRALDARGRAELLARLRAADDEYGALMTAGRYDAADPVNHERRRLRAEYVAGLPLVALSVCPLCGARFACAFDPFDLHGPWWWQSAAIHEQCAPEACGHFVTLRGALSFAGRAPSAHPRHDVHVGPEVPYVIPRLCARDGVVVVVSCLDLHNGYRVYPMGYFADPPVPPGQGAAWWPAQTYTYQTDDGKRWWDGDVDPWDFELGPWLAAGKLLWCELGSDGNVGPVRRDDFPFADLAGARERRIVCGERAWGAGVPNGSPIAPLD